MSIFKDLTKPLKKILVDDYKEDKLRFELKSRVNSDLSVETNAERLSSGKINGDLSFKQTFARNGINSLVTGKLDQDGNVKSTVETTGFANGLKLTAESELHTDASKTNGDYVKLGFDYRQKSFTMTGELTGKKASKAFASTGSATVLKEGLAVGVNASLDINKDRQKLLESYDLALRYQVDKAAVVVALEKNASNLTVGYAQDVNADLSVAAQVAHNLKQSTDDKRKGPVLTVGLSRRLDADSSLKAKVDSTGLVGALYTVRVNKELTTAVTVQSNLLEAEKGSKLGVVFSYSP